jgi:dCMP deaminase
MASQRAEMKLLAFMEICESLSKLSHDTKYRVASIIVTDDFREICSIGYNGDYKGGPNLRTNMEHGQSGFLHSEENCLIHLNKPLELRSHLILMCTHKPCSMCAKRIVNSGIQRVIYKHDYRDSLDQTDDVFRTANVVCNDVASVLSSDEIAKLYMRHDSNKK